MVLGIEIAKSGWSKSCTTEGRADSIQLLANAQH